MLIVYVDDFKLAAPNGEHDALWASIRSVIDMDPETLDGRFLGCVHERFTTPARNVMSMLDNHPSYHPRQKQASVPAAPTPKPSCLVRKPGLLFPKTAGPSIGKASIHDLLLGSCLHSMAMPTQGVLGSPL